MKNRLEITVNSFENLEEIIDSYREEGLSLVEKQSLPNRDVILVFEGERENIAYQTQIENQKGFIEFDDGSVSSLYIKRERNFWED